MRSVMIFNQDPNLTGQFLSSFGNRGPEFMALDMACPEYGQRCLARNHDPEQGLAINKKFLYRYGFCPVDDLKFFLRSIHDSIY